MRYQTRSGGQGSRNSLSRPTQTCDPRCVCLPAPVTSLPALQSGREDLNLRPPGPEPGALTGLRYAPKELDAETLSRGDAEERLSRPDLLVQQCAQEDSNPQPLDP